MSQLDYPQLQGHSDDVDGKPSSLTAPSGDSSHVGPASSGFTREGWMILAGSWMIMFGTYGYIYAFGVYQDFYTRFLLSNHSTGTISWIGSLQLAMPFLLGLVTGKLYDAGHFNTMEIFGSVLFVASLFMLSITKPFQYYQIFLSQGVGMGIGVGFTFTPTMINVAHQFHERKALAAGITLSGTSLGAVVFPIMLNHLIPSIGFGPAVRATAYLNLGLLLVANCLIRRSKRRSSVAQPPKLDIKSFFVEPEYVLFIAGGICALIALYLPLIYMQLFAIEHGIDPTLAFYSIAIINGVSGIGRVAVNFCADLYGPFNLLIPVTVCTGIAIFLLLAVKTATSLVVISAFYGFFSGAWLSVALVCLGAFARYPAEAGARAGVALAIGGFGLLGSAPMDGALLGSNFEWWKPVTFLGALMLGSAFFDVAIRQIVAKRKGSNKV